ncbi:hypothetical protein G7Y79_00020g049020 [Physcia stellaris]|nr:hypothetical protein G7Y79_00020g049020 [Physcia stellaris]
MGRGGAKKDVPTFLDSIKDEHYENFQEKTYVIKEDKKLGMRLDHQGTNQDGTHRTWIQPLENGTSRNVSKAGTNKAIARVIVTIGAKPADVKQGLVQCERSRTNYEYKVDLAWKSFLHFLGILLSGPPSKFVW